MQKQNFSLLALAATLLLTGCGDPASFQSQTITPDNDNTGIVNGTIVEPGTVNSTTFLRFESLYSVGKEIGVTMCGASAISKKVLLTAAHCVKSHSFFRSVSFDTPTKKIEIEVKDAVVHPMYKFFDTYDIAVIFLKEELPAEVEILKLPSMSSFLPSNVLVGGYGKTIGRQNSNDNPGEKLYTKTLKVRFPFLPDNVFTVLQPDGGACQGDSGSPAIQGEGKKRTIVGVLSATVFQRQKDIDPSNPDKCSHEAIYTRVSANIPFINYVRTKHWFDTEF